MDDPRNIFVTQRQNYTKTQQPTGQNPQQTGQGSQQNVQSGAGAPKSSASGQPKVTNAQTEYQQKVEEMQRLAEKYQREGEGQLVKDILTTVIEQKAKGQLTNDQLIAFAKRVSPMLNNDQRERLNQLVEQLIKL